MNTTQWQHIVQEYQEGNQQTFTEFYKALLQEYAPLFSAKYQGLTAVLFEEVLEDKMILILQRTMNHTLEVKEPKKFIYRAIDNYYRDQLRRKKTTKLKVLSLEEETLTFYGQTLMATAPMVEEQDLQQEQRLKAIRQVSADLDDSGKAIIEGLLNGMKDKEIKEAINYKATKAAFSIKKHSIFKKIRKAFSELNHQQ